MCLRVPFCKVDLKGGLRSPQNRLEPNGLDFNDIAEWDRWVCVVQIQLTV